jgi:hypothetical protein
VASSRRFASFLAERAEGEAGESREQFVELALSLRIATVEGRGRQARWVREGEETILSIGGQWDRVQRTWTSKPIHDCRPVVVRITRGGAQERAARWLARWFKAYATNDWEGAGLMRWDERAQKRVRSVWSALLSGGRRSGKSHMACAALVLFAVMVGEAVVWAISPTQDETAELEQAIRRMLPSSWYKYRGSGAGKALTFTLLNGSKILLLSGFKPRGLRRGRVDMVLYNEGQNMSRGGYVQLRPAISDSGGLVLIAANPPTEPIGRWIEEHQEGIATGKVDGVQFEFNPEDNPWIEIAALHSMAAEVDEATYDRDVLGLFRPIGDVVFHAWSDRESRRSVPPGLVDVTEELTRRELGRAFPWLVGMDFQQTPAMAAAVMKLFRDPTDPTEDVQCYVVSEAVVANANEGDLVDALEAADRWFPDGTYKAGAGYQGDECGVVMDASGWWQDGAHNKGKTSDLALRARGWRYLYKPQKDSDKNPDIIERIKVGNARLQTKDGRRHLYVAPSCVQLSRALKYWENRNGVPYRRSQYAHASDALTYPLYRLFARPKPKKGPTGYAGAGQHQRANQLRERAEGDDD